MHKDLLEITIPQLQALYAKGKYTITDVTRWYMGRIQKYNGIYRAVQTVDVGGALQTARTEDADKRATHGPLWGVPVAIKANTAVKGLLNTDGWESSAIPSHEFIAPKDGPVVAKLRGAGAVIIGITNMPISPPATPTVRRRSNWRRPYRKIKAFRFSAWPISDRCLGNAKPTGYRVKRSSNPSWTMRKAPGLTEDAS
jgi:hypothetical protein